MKRILTAITFLLWVECSAVAQSPSQYVPGSRVLMDAHNCYPYSERWNDRIDRALAAGVPLAIEQDLALYTDPATGKSRVIVTHDPKTITGREPSLRDYFFERIRPIIEDAQRSSDHSNWPAITLNLDLKTDDRALIVAVRSVLSEYKAWMTTTVRSADIDDRKPLSAGPLLVLTGESDNQQQVFYDEVPLGREVFVFGAVRVAHNNPMASPDDFVHAPANNYRRWWNNPWAVVEQGGQAQSGAWTHQDRARLKALVQHAHALGYWIRFYTLDGGTAEEFRKQGWFDGYNFGSEDAARARWIAAKEARVDFIASDEYELLSNLLRK